MWKLTWEETAAALAAYLYSASSVHYSPAEAAFGVRFRTKIGVQRKIVSIFCQSRIKSD
jgi:hypothetical protein